MNDKVLPGGNHLLGLGIAQVFHLGVNLISTGLEMIALATTLKHSKKAIAERLAQ
jgi:hypothetical protein